MGNEDLYVCQGRWCRELGAERILKKLKKKFDPMFGKKVTSCAGCRCTSYCEEGVNIVIGEDQIIHNVTEENVFDKLSDKAQYRPLRRDEEIDIVDDFLGDI